MQIKRMMLHIPEILTKQQVAELRQQLDASHAWVHGQQSAGFQAQKSKDDLRVEVNRIIYQSLSPRILQALHRNAQLKSAALPKHLLSPLFTCYRDEGHYGNHVDSAVQYSDATGHVIRTDV